MDHSTCMEFIIFGCDTSTCEEGSILKIYRDGFDAADTFLGHSDDYTSLWGFSKGYNEFVITGGTHLSPGDPYTYSEGEIDSLAAPTPEPATSLLLIGSGITALGLWARKTLEVLIAPRSNRCQARHLRES